MPGRPLPPARPAGHPVLASGLAAATLVAAGLLLALPPGAPASADVAVGEVYERPSDGVFPVDGHGWGHGRGMSQNGAQGAASLGRTADEITAFYYPGTTKASLPDAPIRVLLTDDGRDTDVVSTAGLSATDTATGRAVALPTGPLRWRVVAGAGSSLRLQRLDGATWSDSGALGTPDVAGPVVFSGPPLVRLQLDDGSQRDYRGQLRAVRTATGVASVDVLGLEDYLLGVVPREAVTSWLPAALQAQAIAARSYSAYRRSHPTSSSYDICDTTSCQVFGGTRAISPTGAVTSYEVASTTDAVRATAHSVRSYQGAPVFAEFSSSNGGWSTAGGFPYLVAQRDDWDGAAPSSVHSWSGQVTAAQLEATFPAVGTLARLRVTGRDGNGEWGGRVRTVVLEGVDAAGRPTSVTTDGAGVYGAHSWPASGDGLRSTWWHVHSVPTPETTRLVQAMYLDFLGRPAEPEGLRYWSSRIAGGDLTVQQTALALARTPEYTGIVVTRLYQEVFGRTPDPGGLASWSRVLQDDPSRVAQVAASLYASQEHYERNGSDDRRWVTALYRQVLLRDPDQAGLDDWVALVTSSGRQAVAAGFYDSTEKALQRVQRLYADLLGRAADDSGLQSWPPVVLAQGDIALASFLASSQEYLARAQTR